MRTHRSTNAAAKPPIGQAAPQAQLNPTLSANES